MPWHTRGASRPAYARSSRPAAIAGHPAFLRLAPPGELSAAPAQLPAATEFRPSKHIEAARRGQSVATSGRKPFVPARKARATWAAILNDGNGPMGKSGRVLSKLCLRQQAAENRPNLCSYAAAHLCSRPFEQKAMGAPATAIPQRPVGPVPRHDDEESKRYPRPVGTLHRSTPVRYGEHHDPPGRLTAHLPPEAKQAATAHELASVGTDDSNGI